MASMLTYRSVGIPNARNDPQRITLSRVQPFEQKTLRKTASIYGALRFHNDNLTSPGTCNRHSGGRTHTRSIPRTHTLEYHTRRLFARPTFQLYHSASTQEVLNSRPLPSNPPILPLSLHAMHLQPLSAVVRMQMHCRQLLER